jgi:hypothetical protein
MNPESSGQKEFPIILQSVVCGFVALGFVVTLAPVGLVSWIREFDQEMCIPLPGLKVSLAGFYIMLATLLFWAARQSSRSRFWIIVAMLGSLMLVNISGCFLIAARM